MKNRPWILPIIVIAQFCCTSLWFAGNAVMNELVKTFELPGGSLGNLTSAVQLGFISGTLVFAVFTIADRFSPSKVFFVCALIGAAFNLGTILENNQLVSLLGFRFFTGFFLAGIYPVGMKIAADHFEKGLGKSLGYLVGALVLGTAFPHLLKSFPGSLPWKMVLVSTSAIAAIGGGLMSLFVPDGPYRKPSQRFDHTALFNGFKIPGFRAAAFGYFGHMWELYTFWAFVPFMLVSFQSLHHTSAFNVPLWSFIVIGLGGVSCVIGGYLSMQFGAKKVAAGALALSGICCLVSPFVFQIGSSLFFIGFLIVWGLTVIADSPLFSTLIAQNAQPESKGTALTIVNSIGFAITILSIQLINLLKESIGAEYLFLFLGIGPVLGLLGLLRVKKEETIG